MDRLQSFPNIWLRPPYRAYLGMANTIGIDRVVFTTDYVSIGEEEGEIVAHSTLVIVTQGVSPPFARASVTQTPRRTDKVGASPDA